MWAAELGMGCTLGARPEFKWDPPIEPFRHPIHCKEALKVMFYPQRTDPHHLNISSVSFLKPVLLYLGGILSRLLSYNEYHLTYRYLNYKLGAWHNASMIRRGWLIPLTCPCDLPSPAGRKKLLLWNFHSFSLALPRMLKWVLFLCLFLLFFAVTFDYTDIMKWLKLDEKWNFLSIGNTYVLKNVLQLWTGEAKVLVKWKLFSCEMLQGFVSEEYKGFVLITSKHKIYKAEWL